MSISILNLTLSNVTFLKEARTDLLSSILIHNTFEIIIVASELRRHDSLPQHIHFTFFWILDLPFEFPMICLSRLHFFNVVWCPIMKKLGMNDLAIFRF